jgi:hypothetical protein
MTDTRKALEMAIEALEGAEIVLGIMGNQEKKVDVYSEAINACKEALAQAEKQEIGEAEIRQMLKEIEWCHQELEKIEKQEPVAIVMEDSYGYGASLYKRLPLGTKLYTHPATWQSLSDDEIVWLCPPFYDEDNLIANEFGFARAIEQALKEKNHE